MTENDYECFVPIEIRQLVDALAQRARETLEECGRLVPCVFLGRIDGDVTICPVLHLSKYAAAHAVRRLAQKSDADFVLWIDEAWMKEFRAGSVDEAHRIRDEVGGEVRDMPGRIDIVMFNLQTHVGAFTAYPTREALEGEPGKYTFGAVKFVRPDYSEGRFMGLLTPRGGKQ